MLFAHSRLPLCMDRFRFYLFQCSFPGGILCRAAFLLPPAGAGRETQTKSQQYKHNLFQHDDLFLVANVNYSYSIILIFIVPGTRYQEFRIGIQYPQQRIHFGDIVEYCFPESDYDSLSL